MLLLLLFALVVGAGTAVSPCVLPVLPAMLSASGSGGRRRPFGIVIGLTTTFAITIVGIAKVVGGIGLGNDPLRDVAIVVLVAFGVALLVPQLTALVERPLASLSRLGPRTRGDGFVSGLLVGGALGFVYTPCAGPILAAVISVSAASGGAVAVGLAYALGTGLMLLVLSLGGRRILDRLRRSGRALVVQRSLGVVMVATAIVLATMLDVRLDQWIAQHIPNVNITSFVDNSHAVAARLPDVRAKTSGFASKVAKSAALPGVALPTLPTGPLAPEFVNTQDWFNTAGGKPVTLASLRGKVVLIDFWTYTCINCIRTLPYLDAWYAKYHRDGFEIIGVESPEFPFERDAGNVRNAIKQFGIRYPVVQDNGLSTFNEYGSDGWPAEYLLDATGHLRYYNPYEGDYPTTESAIRVLLAGAGVKGLGAGAQPHDVTVPSSQATPETYLGTARAEGWVAGAPQSGTRTYAKPGYALKLNDFSYGGTWTIGPQQALAGAGATIDARVEAKNVYIVLTPPPHGIGHVAVSVDGHATETITVTGQRLYTVASFASDSQHAIHLAFSPGTSGYSFTFG